MTELHRALSASLLCAGGLSCSALIDIGDYRFDAPPDGGASTAGGGGATGTGAEGFGAGGGTATSASSAGGAVGSGGSGGPSCDGDGDGVTAEQCSGDDCDDANPQVHPGQAGFFDQPTLAGSYDYDCSGKEEFETVTINCAALDLLNCNGQGFNGTVTCGQVGSFGHCVSNVTCGFQATAQQKQRCH